MTKIINLADFRKPVKEKEIDLASLAQSCIDDISINWANAAKINRLNEFFLQSTAGYSSPDLNYISDLNHVSSLEHKIKLQLVLKSPQDGFIGWVAGFAFGDVIIETAPVHFSENYARCFNILLFLKLNRELKLHTHDT